MKLFEAISVLINSYKFVISLRNISISALTCQTLFTVFLNYIKLIRKHPTHLITPDVFKAIDN